MNEATSNSFKSCNRKWTELLRVCESQETCESPVVPVMPLCPSLLSSHYLPFCWWCWKKCKKNHLFTSIDSSHEQMMTIIENYNCNPNPAIWLVGSDVVPGSRMIMSYWWVTLNDEWKLHTGVKIILTIIDGLSLSYQIRDQKEDEEQFIR